MNGGQDMLISTRLVVGLSKPFVGVAITENILNRYEVGRVFREMQDNGTVTAILRFKNVLVCPRFINFLAEKRIGSVVAEGCVNRCFFIGMHHDADTDILTCQTVVVHVACVGGVAHGWCCHRMLCRGVVQACSGCP